MGQYQTKLKHQHNKYFKAEFKTCCGSSCHGSFLRPHTKSYELSTYVSIQNLFYWHSYVQRCCMKAACSKVCQEQINAGFLLIVFVVLSVLWSRHTNKCKCVCLDTWSETWRCKCSLLFFFFKHNYFIKEQYNMYFTIHFLFSPFVFRTPNYYILLGLVSCRHE